MKQFIFFTLFILFVLWNWFTGYVHLENERACWLSQRDVTKEILTESRGILSRIAYQGASSVAVGEIGDALNGIDTALFHYQGLDCTQQR